MNQITADSAKTLHEDIKAALASVAQRHGVKINTGTMTYGAYNASVKVHISTIQSDGTVVDRTRTDYQHKAYRFGLKSEWLGKAFCYGGKQYVVVGLLPKSHRYPVLVVDVASQKRVKVPASAVVTGFTLAAAVQASPVAA